MIWEEKKFKYFTAYRTTIEIGDFLTVNPTEIWEKFFETVLKWNEPESWNAIIVSIWPDSGRFLFYPCIENSLERDEKSIIEVTILEMFNYYEELVDSDIDDSEFGKMIKSKVMLFIEWLERGLYLVAETVKEKYQINKESIVIFFWDADLSIIKKIDINN